MARITNRVTNTSSMPIRDCTRCRKSVASKPAATKAPIVSCRPWLVAQQVADKDEEERPPTRVPTMAAAMRQPNSS